MYRLSRLTAFITVLLSMQPALADTQIIELRYRTAAELLPKVRELLEPYERATDWGQQLVIQADAEKIAGLRLLVEQLDTPVKRLLISLDSGQDSISGGSTNTRNYSAGSKSTAIRSVQTSEGAQTFIRTGQQIQQKHWSLDRFGQPQQQISQRDLSQGFYVVASVQGQRVTLDLYTLDEQPDARQAGLVHSQSSKTRLNLALNQWHDISNLQQQKQHGAKQQQISRRNYSNKNNNLRIKVELLD